MYKKIIFKYLLISLILILGISNSYSQQTNSQQAFKLYSNKNYNQASHKFLELYQLTKSRSYFTYYAQCMLKAKNYKEFEKTIKKEIKNRPKDQSFKIELGNLYIIQGKQEAGNKIYNKIINKLEANEYDIKSTANSFISKREYTQAVNTYIKGQKILKSKQHFLVDIGNTYLYMRDFKSMIAYFLAALDYDSTNVSYVKNRFQSALNQDIDGNLKESIKSALIMKHQNSNKPVFSELLVWFYSQNKEFKKAFKHAIVIDKKNNEDGFGLLRIANQAFNAKQYTIALNIFNYIEKEKTNEKLLSKVEVGKLETKHSIFSDKIIKSEEDIKDLENEYTSFFNKNKIKKENIINLISYADLLAFDLDKITEAKTKINKALSTTGLSSQLKYAIKTKLADILLLENKKWEAILLYTQIEQANKNNPIGFNAKLKKAKVSYFTGEIKWAQMQLDVLKESTSKEIANDALQLSRLISENSEQDTSFNSIREYAKMDFLYYKKKYNNAIILIDSLENNNDSNNILDELLMLKANCYLKINNKLLASEILEKRIKNFKEKINTDKAIFIQAELLEALGKREKALNNYKLILSKYPDSIYTQKSRAKYQSLSKVK